MITCPQCKTTSDATGFITESETFHVGATNVPFLIERTHCVECGKKFPTPEQARANISRYNKVMKTARPHRTTVAERAANIPEE